MKLRIAAAVLLLALTGGFIWGAVELQQLYDEKSAHYTEEFAKLEALEARAEELQHQLQAITAETADANNAQAQQLLQEARSLTDQIAQLQDQITQLTQSLEENAADIDAAQEELTYLQGVYDALEQGLTEVKGYLGEN